LWFTARVLAPSSISASGVAQKRRRTISFLTIDPGGAGFEFVESKRNVKCALIVREGHHEHIFTEAS
jgi:hypothetical protein